MHLRYYVVGGVSVVDHNDLSRRKFGGKPPVEALINTRAFEILIWIFLNHITTI